jgi:hypothetical protein
VTYTLFLIRNSGVLDSGGGVLAKASLLEAIHGYKFWDIDSSPGTPPNPKVWPAIIQAEADAVHQINLRGVPMDDCGPRNVVVDARQQKPFIIDLAQCRSKDRMAKEWL